MKEEDQHMDEKAAGLLEAVARGEEAAFRVFISRYANLLHSFLVGITRDEAVTQELVQDIFLKIWLGRETLKGVRNIKAYLFTISRNLAINGLHKAIKEKEKFTDWSRTQSVEEIDEENWKWTLIDEAVDNLSPQQKKVWLMSRREGLKYREIADQTGLTRETVKKYIQFATAAIIKYVENKITIIFIALSPFF